eukprot:CCRYP_019590-RA/>CCRYP_019590-RA protein AED:0.47 eAED:1.00 QI:0/-1/0/1/-1/0/1/0/9
MTSLLVSLA